MRAALASESATHNTAVYVVDLVDVTATGLEDA